MKPPWRGLLSLKRQTLIYAGILALLLVWMAGASAFGGNSPDSGKSSATQAGGNPALSEESTNDGPHVLWRSPSSATVFYLCNGEVEKRDFDNTDTIRFRGFCSDSISFYTVLAAEPVIQPHVFTGVSKIFAVSDVHGEYRALVELLKNSRVVDENLHWFWGDGHLVINGDVFDRGNKVTECLWLIYRLEQEAELVGGRVHYILGNHELMVLRGDNRYVHSKYLKGIARKTRIKHEDLFGPDMELGRWLRTRHTVVKLNEILFVHGGISPEVMARNFHTDTINELVRSNLDVRSYFLAFGGDARFLFGGKGPLWYRGYITDELYPMATQQEVESILRYYEAEAVVVGHTEVPEVESLYEGRVFAIDIPVEDKSCLQGLLWEDGTFYRVLGSGETKIMR